MLKKILQLIVVLVFTAQGVMAQSVEIDDVTVLPGEISVQVDMFGFTDEIAAITYTIEFDSDLMDFVRIENETLTGNWLANYNSTSDKLIITYTASPLGTGYTINGPLLDLVFDYHGGFGTAISFDEINCEIADKNLASVSATYVAGSVTQGTSAGTVSLDDLIEPIGNSVDMPVTIEGAGFGSVDAISFEISYDPAQLAYASIINNTLSGLVASGNNGLLSISWTGTAQDFTTATNVFDIQFVYYGGSASVEFLPGSEIADASVPLAATYVDGSVSPAPATATLTIDAVGGVPGSGVTVPIVASGFTGIDAGPVSLNISFDNTKLTYTGFTAQQLTSWIVSSNGSGQISMECTNGAGTAITDATLVTLNFNYAASGGEAAVAFGPGSELQSINLVTIPVTFVDGNVAGFTVDGQLTYNNDGVRPIYPATVYLRNLADDVVAYTTTTDANGDFEFTGVGIGSFYLDATTTIDGSQAYDISDAFDIAFIGGTLTGLQALAADVNEVGGIDISDAFDVANSCPTISPTYVKVSSWTAPEWIFENTSVTVTTSNETQNFGGICSGDANAAGFTP